MKRKKVLFILRIPPPYGGGEIVSQELYEAIKNDSQFKFKVFSWKFHSKSRQATNNHISFINGLGYISSVIFSIIRYKPTAIYLGLPKSFGAFFRNSVIILFCSSFRINIFAELHGMCFPFDKNTLKRKYLVFIIKRISKIRVLGENIIPYFKSLGYKKEIKAISNGITVPQKYFSNKKQIDNSSYNFLYLGAISAPKGFNRVINLFNKLQLNGYTNFNLHVVGEWIKQTENEEFNNSEEYKNLKSNLVFHGKLIGDEKWEVINLCHYLIHLTSFDGQPLTVIETMSIGIPSISTYVGTIPEMIDNNSGFLVNDDGETFLVIEKILNNKINYEEMSKAARDNYIKNYTVDKMAAKITNFVKT